MKSIGTFIKENRKAAGLTQEEFAIRAGLGLRFVCDLEQGKETVRMDKVNQALAMFGMRAVPGKADDEWAHFGKRRSMCGIDFVCNLGSRRYYIQSAYSIHDEQKLTQETRPFTRIDDSFKKIVITRDIVPAHYDDRGILTINIYDFLLDSFALEK